MSTDRYKTISKMRGKVLAFDDGYLNVAEQLIKLHNAAVQPTKQILFLVAGKIGLKNDWDLDGELAGNTLMGWEQVQQLSAIGVEIGSHSLTHPDLTKLNSKDLEKEVKTSKQILESRLGCSVEQFAYPYGLWNENVLEAVRDAGYSSAVTTSGSIWEGRGNPFRKSRIELKGTDSLIVTGIKMSWLYQMKAVYELPILLYDKLKRTMNRD